MKQPTMVYRPANEDDKLTVERDGTKYAYQIVELDDDESVPDGWARTIGEPLAPAKVEKKPKNKPAVKEDNGDSEPN